MTAPAVAGVNSGGETTATTTHTVTFDSSPSSGDLLVIRAVVDWDTASSVTGPSGFTELYNATHSGGNVHTCVWYKQADGTEGASITYSTDANEESRYSVWRITGHENPSTQAPELQAADSPSNNANPDPPSITPTGGSKDYLILAGFGADTGNLTVSVWPYANNNISQSGSNTSNGVTLGDCNDAITAATINPGTFTINVNRPWTAHTVAVHPAGAGPSGRIMGKLAGDAGLAGCGGLAGIGGGLAG